CARPPRPPPHPPLFPYTTLFRSKPPCPHHQNPRRFQAPLASPTNLTQHDVAGIPVQFHRCKTARGRGCSRGGFTPQSAQCDTVADRKSTRLNSSHVKISYAVFCL